MLLHYFNPQIDSFIQNTVSELDVNLRNDIYAEMEEISTQETKSSENINKEKK